MLTQLDFRSDNHGRRLRDGHASHVAVRPRLCKARFLRIAAVGMADGESRLSTLRVDGPTHPVRDIKGYFGLELQNF